MKSFKEELEEASRLLEIRRAFAARVGHTCPRYVSARTYAPHWEGLADPALQEGIGCPLCFPPDGKA